jgi:hypothetical protein
LKRGSVYGQPVPALRAHVRPLANDWSAGKCWWNITRPPVDDISACGPRHWLLGVAVVTRRVECPDLVGAAVRVSAKIMIRLGAGLKGMRAPNGRP